ncbi:Fe-S cluster assembly protein SufD [Streptococcaceae bacterium ESL0687]|nr:Fe-S cluster assembly protein SufD [Streptococcaceae bacterium ESL0687]
MKENYKEYKTSVEKFSKFKNEPAWMGQLRLDALEKMDELKLPLIERVKYERWPLFDFDKTNLCQSDELEMEAAVEEFSHGTLIQKATAKASVHLTEELIEAGVIFMDLFAAMEEYPELVQKYYMTRAVKVDEDKMTAAHAAFMNGGAFLYVPKDVVIKEPLESLFYGGSTNDRDFRHVLIVAGENSKFSYLERFQEALEGQGPKTAANIVVEVIAEAGAQVKFSAIDQLGANYTSYMNRRGHLERDASIDWAIGVMNEGNVVADFDSDLMGDGSHARIKAVAVSSGKQIQGIDTRVTNYGKNSVGHILQHGVILEAGTLTFNGIGHIIRGAKGADAQQESRVLMLSDKARSDANPILLIDENDVTAGHAASIGQVDPEDMYYLQSRGLDVDTAERLVIRGFLGSVITEIPIKEVQAEMVQVIDRKLDKR